MKITLPILSFLLRQLLILPVLLPCCRIILTDAAGGKWDLLLPNIGISAMHMQLLNNDKVVIFDRTDNGRSNISLPKGKCGNDPNDCTAHSVEYDVATNSVRPLRLLTDTWCSSGAVMLDGTLIQTGGFNHGDHAVRVYKPCRGYYCDWQEFKHGLTQRRWYATNHILPDGRQIIIGGRLQFNYEFYPKVPLVDKPYLLPFLARTNDPKAENNLYPFVFLNVDGNLFIFANNQAILFDYTKRKEVKTYPTMPGGDPRNYPSTGSAVLLPLKNFQGGAIGAEVLVCGGAPKGAYLSAKNNGNFVTALSSCGRIQITAFNPQWTMETMPLARVMGDMVLLPNGKVLFINGASVGTAGWDLGRNPVLSPVIYHPDKPSGSRFEVQKSSSTPRMYHSTAILLRDGRVLVGGSNPHPKYNFIKIFPTDLSLEAFSPSYLDPTSASLRPKIFSPASQSIIGYGQQLTIKFTIPPGRLNKSSAMVTIVAPSFNTHSFSMNQRLLVLGGGKVVAIGLSKYKIQVVTPGSKNLAPPGYYLLFVVHQDVPSEGIWVQIK
ncbi:Hypothetical predicted protein [Olea europaea subsp. europaea]|uniref:Galactose oxidase n=1 Tax=Olea europaea subsp. europaea TaxID=158383 RepID=A0A8S0VPY1_OLEEU|nr:Hypothetical predicted protein [Olea europaea subsp. europaea]